MVAAGDGPTALDLLGRLDFDVMFTDIMLPGSMTGWEIAAAPARGSRSALTSGQDASGPRRRRAPAAALRPPHLGGRLRYERRT